MDLDNYKKLFFVHSEKVAFLVVHVDRHCCNKLDLHNCTLAVIEEDMELEMVLKASVDNNVDNSVDNLQANYCKLHNCYATVKVLLMVLV